MPASPVVAKSFDIDELFAKRVRTVTIPVTESESIWVKYKPDALDKKLQAMIAEAENDDAAAMLMVELLAEWSLTKGGEPYPITVENLEALGLPIMVTISALVQEDFETNVQMGKAKEPSRESNGD